MGARQGPTPVPLVRRAIAQAGIKQYPLPPVLPFPPDALMGVFNATEGTLMIRHATLFEPEERQLDNQQTSTDDNQESIEKTLKNAREQRDQDEWDARCRAMPRRVDRLWQEERAFRHGAWAKNRLRVHAALKRAKVKQSRLRRFECCGSSCQVSVSQDGSQVKLDAFYCGDRFCKPCQKARAKIVGKNILKMTAGKSLSLVTLTLMPLGGSYSATLDHLLASFARLRSTKFWRKVVAGGVAVVEATRGSHNDHWHIHLHAIAEAKFIDRIRLSKAWAKASKGSYIVHVAKISKPEKAIKYVAAYATKGFSDEIYQYPNHLTECIRSLRGRRLLCTFGGWYGCELEKDERPRDGFRRVGPLVAVLHAARDGWPFATKLLADLGFKACPGTGAMRLTRVREFVAGNGLRQRVRSQIIEQQLSSA